MCISLLSEVHLSLELGPSARATERLISESWSGFLCAGSCGDGGGRVSRSMWKASLFQRSSLVWERGLKTDLNTALWLGTQQRAALSNHTPNFDWHVQSGSGSMFKWRLFIFITSNQTQGTSQVIGALSRCNLWAGPVEMTFSSWPRLLLSCLFT